MGTKVKYKQGLAVLLLAIFTTYYVNVSFFYHCHTINGVTIVHSHIHDKDHKNSTHSNSELTLITSLCHFQTLAVVLFYTGAIILTLLRVLPDKKRFEAIRIRTQESISLRAPPFFIH